MKGRLVAAGGPSSDLLLSPTSVAGVSPAATPRATTCGVGLYYFLLFFHGGGHEGPSESAHAGRPSLDGNRKSETYSQRATSVVTIDNVTGQFFYSGTPNVDLFRDEATAMLSIPGKTSLSPDGVKIHRVCSFDAWVGAFATDEHLHLLFVFESASATLGGQTDTAILGAPPSAPQATTAIRTATRVGWKSIRLQFAQSIFTAPSHTLSGDAPFTAPRSSSLSLPYLQHRPSGERDSSCSRSNTVDVDNPLDATLTSISDLHPPSSGLGSPQNESQRELHFSYDFDLSSAKHSRQFLEEHRWFATPNEKPEASPPMAAPTEPRFFTPTHVLLKDANALVMTEFLWNIELIRFCDVFGVGHFCARLVYGHVGLAVCPPTSTLWHQSATFLVISRLSRAAFRGTLLASPSSWRGCLRWDARFGCWTSTADVRAPCPSIAVAELPHETEIQILVKLEEDNPLATASGCCEGTNGSDRREMASRDAAAASTAATAVNKTLVECVMFRGFGSMGAQEGDTVLAPLRRARERRLHKSLRDVSFPLLTTTAKVQTAVTSVRNSVGTPSPVPAAAFSSSSPLTPVLSSMVIASGSPSSTTHKSHECGWEQAANRFPPKESTDDVLRCVMSDERHLQPTLLVAFVRAVGEFSCHSTALAESFSQELFHPTSGEQTALGVLWQLLAEEAASWVHGSALSSPLSSKFVHSVVHEILRWHWAHPTSPISALAELACHQQHHSVQSALLFADGSGSCGVELDTTHHCFLQAVVERPPAELRRRRVLLLSDPNSGAHVVRALVVLQTPESQQGRAEPKEVALVADSNSGTTPAEAAPPGVPPFAVLRSVWMPKSTPLLFPTGCEAVSMTLAIPGGPARLRYVGIVVQPTAQDVMFASPLTLTVSCSDSFLSRSAERVLIQEVPLPICVGSAAPTVVLYPLADDTFTSSSRELPRSATPGAAGVPGDAPKRCVSSGRLFTVTIRSSGMIPMILGNLYLFGEGRTSCLAAQILARAAGGSSSTREGDVKPWSSSSRNVTSLECESVTSTVYADAEDALRRHFLKKFSTLRGPKGTAAAVPLRQSRPTNLMDSVTTVTSASTPRLQQFTRQTRERFCVTETQRTVLLRQRLPIMGDEGASAAVMGLTMPPPIAGAQRSPRSPVSDRGMPSPASWLSQDATAVGDGAAAEAGARGEARSASNQPNQGGDCSPSLSAARFDAGNVSPRAKSPTGGVPSPFHRSPSATLGDLVQSNEELYLVRLHQVSPPDRAAVNVTLADAVTLEAFRIRSQISTQTRDRICARAKYHTWLLDPVNNVLPKSFFCDPSVERKARQGSGECHKCRTKLGFFSKKRECHRCGAVLCVRCTVDHPVRILEIGLQDAVATVCASCLTEVNRVEVALSDLARALQEVSLVGSAEVKNLISHTLPVFRLQCREAVPCSPSAAAPGDCGSSAVVPVTHTRGALFASCLPTSRSGRYNLTVADNAVVVIRGPPATGPFGAGGGEGSVAVEEVIGGALPAGQGFRLSRLRDTGAGARSVTAKSLVFLLPGNAEVDEVLVVMSHSSRPKGEAKRRQGSAGDDASSLLHPEDRPLPSHVSTAELRCNVGSVLPSRGLDVGLFLTDSADCQEQRPSATATLGVPVVSCDDGEAPRPISVVLRVDKEDEPVRPCRIVCLRFVGIPHDLAGVELLHISAWGRYVVAGSGVAAHSHAKSMFHLNGGAGGTVASQRYSLRNVIATPEAPTVHRHLSFVSHATAERGTLSSSPQHPLLPKTLSRTRLVLHKATHTMTDLAPHRYVTEYDLGTPSVVSGVILEHHHLLVSSTGRIATHLRFIAVSSDGKRANVAYITIPIPMISSYDASTGTGGTAGSGPPDYGGAHHLHHVAVDPLSMAFAFPTSCHDTRAIQVEICGWRGGAAASSGTTPATPAAHAASTLSTPLGNNSAQPFLGKLSFWGSTDAHTRHFVSSAPLFGSKEVER